VIPSRGWKASSVKSSSRFLSPSASGDAKALNERLELRPISEIEHNASTELSDCSFCYLVWELAKDQLALTRRAEFDDDDVGVSVHATWEIDGRQLEHYDQETCFFEIGIGCHRRF
jgi:hypothetical protein